MSLVFYIHTTYLCRNYVIWDFRVRFTDSRQVLHNGEDVWGLQVYTYCMLSLASWGNH